MLGIIEHKQPDRIRLRASAGRFNFSFNNAKNRFWIFPAGTVLYSDGVTAIATSTAQQPDVTIPVGGGDVWLRANFGGNFSMNDNSTDARYVGALADLQGKITHYLNLANCLSITGSLADLQGKITYLLSLLNCANVTGSLADLQGKITYHLNLSSCANITGDLADLQGKIIDYLGLANCARVTGVYTPVGAGTPTITALSNTGLSATDMDNTLIAYAAATKNNGSFTATGMTRTAASDAAVATLTGRGWTISGITKV